MCGVQNLGNVLICTKCRRGLSLPGHSFCCCCHHVPTMQSVTVRQWHRKKAHPGVCFVPLYTVKRREHRTTQRGKKNMQSDSGDTLGVKTTQTIPVIVSSWKVQRLKSLLKLSFCFFFFCLPPCYTLVIRMQSILEELEKPNRNPYLWTHG